MTHEQLNETIFYANKDDRKIESCTYREYLNRFGSDETTSPRGVESRLHVRETEDNDGMPLFNIWTWGVGGNNPRHLETFENEEDADLYIFEQAEYFVKNKNWDAPPYFATYEEAITELSILLEKDEAVLLRYFAIKEITEQREVDAALQRLAIKEQLAKNVLAEAEDLIIDKEFCNSVKLAQQKNGMEKNNLMAAAMKGLLQRNNRDKIHTDFWQVARILISKVK